MSNWRVHLATVDYGAEEEAAAVEVIRSQWLSMGPQVQAFEQEMSERLGVPHAFATANATAALHLAYLALDIQPGAEIIQPAINFVAAANMTLAIGATPVFADIAALDEPILDPASVEARITPRTKAVLVMYYGGYFGRTMELLELCRRHNLPLIEDACHAVGAQVDGHQAGSIGDVACFSFFSNKNMATGEGGMLTTRRADIAERVKLLRSHGMTTLTWERDRGHASSYDVRIHGFNYRLDELHAALGRAQLRKLDGNNARRRQAVAHYRSALRGFDGWTIPFMNHRDDTAAHLMVAVAPNPESRQRAAAALKDAGVQTSLHYPSIPTFTAFQGFDGSHVPLSREYGMRALTLPLHPKLSTEDIDLVCSTLRASAAVGNTT